MQVRLLPNPRERKGRQPERKTRGLSCGRVNSGQLKGNRIIGKKLEITLMYLPSYLPMLGSSAELMNIDMERGRSSISSSRGPAPADPGDCSSLVPSECGAGRFYALI